MDLTDSTVELKDKNTTDHIEEPEEVETVDATNDPPKVKPKMVNLRQLKKEEKIGRNASCPCGSGKKYKKCHLLMQQQQMIKQQEIRRQVDEFTKKISESKSEKKKIPQEDN